VFWTTRFRLDMVLKLLITVGAAEAAYPLRRGEWMHRTFCRPRNFLLGGLLLALLVSGRPESLNAQIPGTTGSSLIVPIGGTVPVQMTTKKAITLVKNSKEDVLGIKTVPGDPKRVNVVGLAAGLTHIELTDEDGKVESYDVTVQLDVEFLRTQLHRAFPTANVEPVPIGSNAIALEGTVNRIEDVDAILRIAQAAAGSVQIVSRLRIAGVQQVQLCVTVAQVRRNDLRRMAFNFLTNTKNTFLGSTVGQAVVEPASIGVGGSATTGSILSPAFLGQTLSGVPGTPNGAPTNLLFGVIHNNFGFLGFLQALRDESVVSSLAEPTLTTMSGRPASFLVGGEQAVPVPAGLGQIGVQFEEFGTRLNFLPIVLGNGKIHLEVEPEVSRLDAANGTAISGTVVPGRDTTRVNTTVELEDGQTFVIGGLIQREIAGTTEKTPVLGDLPFLGAAFSSKSYSEIETEMVVMVTVHLVDAEDCAQAPKILPGQETRRPDDFELFLEGILEAPRGPREVFPGKRYVPAYKNGPTSALFPCAGRDGSGGVGCAACGAGGAATVPSVPDNAAPNHPAAPKGTEIEAPMNHPAAPKGTEIEAPMNRPAAPDSTEIEVPLNRPAPDIQLPRDLPPAVIPESNDPK
jgi:pilus assembly protein CpaC